MKNRLLSFTALLLIFCASCELIDIVQPSDTATGTVYYWISSDADTYAECVMAGGACTSTDTDHSGRDGLVAANTTSGIKRSYINFPRPLFPAGTVIEEAYVELYHSGKNEDGKTDDIQVRVDRVRTAWNAGTLRYFNQPVQTGNTGEFSIRLESLDWSGTANIASALQQDFTGTSPFEGFVIFISSFEPGYEKGFYSGNHRSRTLTDLGFAPRLMLKVKLPSGVTTEDVTFPQTHTDGSSGGFLGFRFRQGADWPSDWDLAIRD